MTDAELDLVFKALADPTRRRIIERLDGHPGQTLFEVCAATLAADGSGLSRQTISQHLDILERAGLVRTARKGRTKIHTADLSPLRLAADHWLGRFIQED
jgi:DNA-binding transcriptional ArsR family regulator